LGVVRLVQITDTHLHADATAIMRGVNTLETLRQTLRAAHAELAAADAVLHTGDAGNDDPGGYLWLQRELGGLGKPILCIPGNHDDPALLRAALAAPFRHCGQHDFGAWRIVMLDSRLADEASGALSHAELARLDAALGALEGRQALVVLHHHPVTSHSAWLDTVALRDPDALFAVLDRHAGVRGLLWGHVHQVYEGARRDVRLMGTPSTCVQFLPRVPHFAVDTLPPAYRTLTLHADGRIDSQVHWVQ
jgi:Icc protein